MGKDVLVLDRNGFSLVKKYDIVIAVSQLVLLDEDQTTHLMSCFSNPIYRTKYLSKCSHNMVKIHIVNWNNYFPIVH